MKSKFVYILILLFLPLVSILTENVWAQEYEAHEKTHRKAGAYSEDQLQLLQIAEEATKKNDYAFAELAHRTNLVLGEFDFTWLKLGKVLTLAGKCSEARDAYEHVTNAPKLLHGDNLGISVKLKQYQTEFEQQCPNVLTADNNTKISTTKPNNLKTYTKEQVQLCRIAEVETLSGDYKLAEFIYRTVLLINEFDRTWLELGRVLALAGKCSEARNAYERVHNAPKMLYDNPLDVSTKLEQYQKDLLNQCQSTETPNNNSKKILEKEHTQNNYTNEQIKLNEAAVKAVSVGNYELAEYIYRSNLSLGEFNLTWLNLGLTLALAGKCFEAREAYEHVPNAPKLFNDNNLGVSERFEESLKNLNIQCQAAFANENHTDEPNTNENHENPYTTEQLKLHHSANLATQAGDYQTAEKNYRESIQLGAFNLTYLELGKVLALAGKCTEAREAYQKVPTAPKLQNDKDFTIATQLEQYQKDLDNQCQTSSVAAKNSDSFELSTYTKAGIGLFSVGLIGLTAGIIMIETNSPEYIKEEFFFDISPESIDSIRAYNNQLKAAKVTPVVLGTASLITGITLIIADVIMSRKENSTIETKETMPQAYHEQLNFSPYLILHPEISGLGAQLQF